jgi:hypothetical protein
MRFDLAARPHALRLWTEPSSSLAMAVPHASMLGTLGMTSQIAAFIALRTVAGRKLLYGL